LGSGNIPETDLQGNNIGSFSTRFSAYSLAYGQSISPKLSLGITTKLIQAHIQSLSAQAYALDIGGLYKIKDNLTLAGVLTNLGSELKFISQSDPLPLALRLGLSYRRNLNWLLAVEGVYRRNTLASFHLGLEYRPIALFALRAGYKTDTIKELSPLAGLSTGIGVHVGRQELAYSWVPMGPLGNTQHVSLVVRFGGSKRVRSDAQLRRVLFAYEDKGAQSVMLIGDFNEWVREPMVRDERGLWVMEKRLGAGKYRYNFVVDGREIKDPRNERVELNAWRNECSVLYLESDNRRAVQWPIPLAQGAQQ
jgi:hypothetical protein